MIIQAAVSSIVLVLFVVAAGYNGLVFLRHRRGQDGGSVIPLFGGVLGAVGLWLWPYHELAAWAWAPPVLDYGFGAVVLGLVQEVRRAWRYRAGNCFLRLSGASDEKTVEIRLYRGGWMEMEQTFSRPRKVGVLSSRGKWSAAGPKEGYTLEVWGATVSLARRDGRWVVTSEGGWSPAELALSAVTLTAMPPPRDGTGRS